MMQIEGFFQQMDSMQRIYWYIAIGVSVVFVVQTIMTFIGSDIDVDTDTDLDGAGHHFQLWSLRNLINFLLGFSWAGVAFYTLIDSKVLVTVIAIVVGLLFVAIFGFVIAIMMKLAENNSFEITKVVGLVGEVYLTIPADGKAKGKVFISYNGSVKELDAITLYSQPITNGTLVKVVKVDADILVVEPFSK